MFDCCGVSVPLFLSLEVKYASTDIIVCFSNSQMSVLACVLIMKVKNVANGVPISMFVRHSSAILFLTFFLFFLSPSKITGYLVGV